MAITLSRQPDLIAPVFSDRNKFVMSEAGATYFTLVFSGDVTGTFKIYPNTLGIAEFNARYLLENYIYSQIALHSQATLPNGLKSYNLTITSSLASIKTFIGLKFFNGALQEREENRAADGFILNNAWGISFFTGLDSKMVFDDLTGITIVRYSGTTTLSIVGNEIIGTRGTCWNLLLSDGTFFSNPHNGKFDIIEYEALFDGFWNDNAVWNDTDIWND